VPNYSNITAPINIHGIGRSGTTLLQNMLGATGVIQVCNETAGLVFACYRGAEASLFSDDRDPPNCHKSDSVCAVHASLCAIAPSSKPRWCQKLGGLPTHIVWNMKTAADLDHAGEPFAFPFDWYWTALRGCFPAARNILIVRDYRDVIISRHRFSGWQVADIAADMAVYFNLMAHRLSNIEYVIRFEDLVSDPHQTVCQLAEALELDNPDRCLEAMQWYASGSGERDLIEAKSQDFSWCAYHTLAETDTVRRTIEPSLTRFERRFGMRLMI